MWFRVVVKPTGQPAKNAVLLQAVQCNTDRFRAAKVEKCPGRKTCTSPFALYPTIDAFFDRLHGLLANKCNENHPIFVTKSRSRKKFVWLAQVSLHKKHQEMVYHRFAMEAHSPRFLFDASVDLSPRLWSDGWKRVSQ